MTHAKKIVLYILLPCAILAAATVGYEFRAGFPRTIEGRRVHRVTIWSQDDYFQRDRMYYVYTGDDGKEIKHGPFQNYDHGHLVETVDYHEGKLGTATFLNVFGDKTQEVYYIGGAPHGWANYANGKLFTMRLYILQEGHVLAAKSFANGQYSLAFNCGELINSSIDPASGQITPIPDASKRACADSSGGSVSTKAASK